MAKKEVSKDNAGVAKNPALESALAQIQKQFGKEAIMKMGDGSQQNIEAISSGSLGLDIALGVGGYPKGRIVEIYGPESSGKTTLALQVIAEAQKLGGEAAFIDAEHALDPEYAEALGVDINSLLVSQPDNGEQALEITEALARSGALDVIIVDSVAALVPKAEILPISALNKFNVDTLLKRIVELLPQQHAWYDRDVFTDKSMRFFASEIIREKILQNYNKEIPYCTEVVIESFEESEEIYNISAIINVVRESQKGIIIGPKGLALKRVGTQARRDMEKFFEKKVFLKMFVKVNPNWREDKKELKKFGYIF